MAPPAAERAAGLLRARWAELVAPAPGRAEFALRLALVCTLATWLAQAYETPEAALSAYVAFFMNKPDRAGSVLTSVAMVVLISIVIGLLLLIAGVALDTPALRVAIMAGLSLVLLFLASASKLKPLASTIALILAYALDLLGKAPSGELATRALLYAWLMVGIPAGVSIVVNLLIGPAPRRLAERAIALRLRTAQALLQAPGAAVRRRAAALRRQGEAPVLDQLRLAMLERTSAPADLLALQQAARSAELILMLAEAIDRSGDLPRAWRDAAAATLGEMAGLFDRHRYPLDIAAVSPADAVPPVGAAASLAADFNAALLGFAVAPSAPGMPPSRARGGFFVPDAFRRPEHVRYAVKVTLAAMSCYLFYSLTDWQGIHTCLITCYIVALDTTAETIEKLSLRILGALAGAAAGLAAIVWVTPSIDRIEGLLALVFAGGLAGAWIAAGSARIAYAGFQLAFAFFLCVIQGSTPAFDLTVARDRVIGILIGNAAIYLVFVFVWPVSIAHRIDLALAALLRQFGRLARRPLHAERVAALPAAHAAAAKAGADLQIARYEPASLRPPADWFDQRQTLLSGFPAREHALLLAGDRTSLDALAAQLDRLAEAIESGQLSAPAVDIAPHHPEQGLAH